MMRIEMIRYRSGMSYRRKQRSKVKVWLGKALLASPLSNSKKHDSAAGLRCSEGRSIVDTVLNAIAESRRWVLQSAQQRGKCPALPMRFQCGNVLEEKHARPKERDVLWHRAQDSVMPVAAVMESVAQLAEAFTWRTCCEELNLAELFPSGCY